MPFVEAGCDPVPLVEKEVWGWQQRWRAVFAKELHIATGKWVFNGFDWHVFSFGHHESKTSDAAWSEYRRLVPCSFLVLSAEDRSTRLVRNVARASCSFLDDDDLAAIARRRR